MPDTVCAEIKVRGYHLDVYEHVNNARYLEFLEEARWAYFDDHLDLPRWRREGLVFVLVNVNLNFRRPAYLGEVLEVTADITRIGNSSCAMRQCIRLKGTDTLIADADVIFAMADENTGRAIPLEGEPRSTLEKLMAA